MIDNGIQPQCPKCQATDLIIERRLNGDAICNSCNWHGPYADCYKKLFDKIESDERQWFKDRGYGEADLMFADAAYKEYLRVETSMPNARPFDKAPGFRRVFMMGYFYGRNK